MASKWFLCIFQLPLMIGFRAMSLPGRSTRCKARARAD
jgi:hypothetical protein